MTMYRVSLYGLCVIALYAIILGFLGVLSFSGISLITVLFSFVFICYFSNTFFSKIFNAPANVESSFITALILFCIVLPPKTINEWILVFLIGIIAMASKYIFTINRKHIFNPVAISLVIAGLIGFNGAGWWIGSASLLPVVLIVGLLIVRKIRRTELFISGLLSAIFVICIYANLNHQSILVSIPQIFLSYPIIFFATVMLTEPMTTPPTKNLQIIYGTIAGIFFGLQFHIGPLFSSPELALVVANIYSYAVSSKQKLFLQLKEKIKLSPSIYEFVFTPSEKLSFSPGQYLEWTLGHKSDSRGVRRFFTIASSPTESDIRVGVKIPEQSSSYKQKLLELEVKDTIVASQLSGDFVLPENQAQKLVFIAGGIGITPYRSMIKYLLDRNEKRDIILFYANSNYHDFVYKNIFEKAEKKLGFKIHFVITDTQEIPARWNDLSGHITDDMIKKEVSDYDTRTFYISGPNAMVEAYKTLLLSMGVKRKNIIFDYFPGY